MTPVAALLEALSMQVELVGDVPEKDLAKPTPCKGWTVRHVLAHTVVVTRKFSDFAAEITDAPRTPTNDLLVADHLAAVRREAIRAAAGWSKTSPDRMCHLPFGAFNAAETAGINLVDVTAHTWDVATAIGIELDSNSDV